MGRDFNVLTSQQKQPCMHLVRNMENENRIQKNVMRLEIRHVSWYHPKNNCIDLNCNDTYKTSTFVVGCEGLLRDALDNRVRGYARKIDLCDALVIEMSTILNELQLTWQEIFTNLVVKSDTKFFGWPSFSTLVHRIKIWLNRIGTSKSTIHGVMKIIVQVG